jgi:anthranilate phosphoribosyltransferase
MKRLIGKMADGQNLTREEAEEAMIAILEGAATQTQYAGFLVALRMKGETVEEITGFARIMRERCAMIRPKVDGRLIDTCGTGGAPVKTFNISTISAFVAAGAGVPVAKHGNRAVTSPCGSADVLEALGANLSLAPASVERVIEEVGVGFLFAPAFHPAMKHAGGARRELGIRTVFNILGPLTNPAGARGQVLGVFHPSLIPKLTPVLANLGVERAMVVHGEGGLDEFSPIGPTRAGIVEKGTIRYVTFTPEEFGIARVDAEAIGGLDKAQSAAVFRDVLDGRPGARTDTVVLNAACALWVGGKVETVGDGIAKARESIESGRAREKLARFVEATGRA